LATLEAKLQQLVDRLDRVSGKYSLLINFYKTKVMASDGIVCHILIQNKQLEQAGTFPWLQKTVSVRWADDRDITAENMFLRWKGWETFCKFCKQQRKQISGLLTKMQ